MISFEKAYFLLRHNNLQAQYEALDKLQRETLKRWNYVVLLDHLQSSGGTSFKLIAMRTVPILPVATLMFIAFPMTILYPPYPPPLPSLIPSIRTSIRIHC
ncbi:hypothetical protein C0995_014622 [Termitomyces sp. Mi166|nr:hypothetical protein C0995_014622 [Termitomyces sp. Mi166\